MNEQHGLWCERFRPTTLDEYVGNDDLKQKIQEYIDAGDVPHLLFYGKKPGTGKTTLAKIIVNNIDCDYIYINASSERGIDTVRDRITGFASSIGFKDKKIVVLDEADQLTADAQTSLRNLMETFSHHTRFILTCNYVEKIIEPIQSRCGHNKLTRHIFEIIPPSKKEVAVRIAYILKTEKVSFEMQDLATLVNAGYPDIRVIINLAQVQVVDGKLQLDDDAIVVNDYKQKLVQQLADNTKRKDAFKNVRQLLADSQISDYTDLYTYLYETIDDWAEGHTANCILILAEHQSMDSLCVDKEINIMAMIIKLIGEVK